MKGKILGSRYKILEYLAEGGFGRTYLAEDTQLPGKDTCVVKQLYPSSQNPRFLQIARRLFKTEASVLHNLGHHQQIPELLAYFEEEEKFYLVQQYIQGKTLATELNPERIWSEVEVVELLQDILNILQFIHDKRVIHRDVKPDNLIRRQSDRKLVLVDFGTVKEVLQGQANLGQLTVAVGTQGYMPTEQARGKPQPTSDLYALGMIGIQALTGIIPIDLDETDEGEIIWQTLADVGPGLAQILTQMTRYHFKDRYQSAAEILQELAKLSSSNVTKPQSITAVYPSQTKVLNQESVRSTDTNSQAEKLVSTGITGHSNQNNTSDVSRLVSHTEQMSATVINPISEVYQPAKSTKSTKKKGISAIIALGIAIAVGGTYLAIQQLTPGSEVELPNTVDRPDNSTTDLEPDLSPNPTERKPQSGGFREDL